MAHSGLRTRLNPAERRRAQRIYLQIPVFVRCRDSNGRDFNELTKTLDISATGAFIASSRALQVENTVFLTVPAPAISSSGLVPNETPPIQARVRRQHTAGDIHMIGLEFLKSLD